MKILMTGTSGNMGSEALKQTMQLDNVDLIRVLITLKPKNNRYINKLKKQYGDRIEVVRGDIADKQLCVELVKDMDYVVHMAAVIPPKSDWNFRASYECNQLGSIYLVDAIKQMPKQAKYIHISSVAVYGNRNEIHPWCRVGDPLLPSTFDNYAQHKMIAERYVMEADLDKWVVLRQSAMLNPNLLKDNISDGLMFHTPLNAPLEWVSARDSGYLIKCIIQKDREKSIDKFWYNVYNIGAGAENRKTGYDTFRDGFSIIGGSAEKFFKPSWCSIRNFHGVWFADSEVLNSFFNYQRDTTEIYWQEIANKNKIYKVAKIIPSWLITQFVFHPLLKNGNSPKYWIDTNNEAKIKAFFGSKENIKMLPNDWNNVNILSKNKEFFESLRDLNKAVEQGKLLSHGYDENKAISEWTIEDMQSAAEFRGGKCLSESMEKGNAYKKLKWMCNDGHVFYATPYTVLKGGHWCPECVKPNIWEYDRLAKVMPYYAQVWYDSHAKEENIRYYFDEKGMPQYEVF